MFILSWIFFGALTGWVASRIVNRRGEGCMVNTALGLVGALVGGFLFQTLTHIRFTYEFHSFLIQAIVAVIGAVIVLVIWNAVTGNRTLR